MMTKTWNIIPTTIKTILIKPPRILEKAFEIRVLKNPPTSNPFGYLHLYLRHGAKKDFSSDGREK